MQFEAAVCGQHVVNVRAICAVAGLALLSSVGVYSWLAGQQPSAQDSLDASACGSLLNSPSRSVVIEGSVIELDGSPAAEARVFLARSPSLPKGAVDDRMIQTSASESGEFQLSVPAGFRPPETSPCVKLWALVEDRVSVPSVVDLSSVSQSRKHLLTVQRTVSARVEIRGRDGSPAPDAIVGLAFVDCPDDYRGYFLYAPVLVRSGRAEFDRVLVRDYVSAFVSVDLGRSQILRLQAPVEVGPDGDFVISVVMDDSGVIAGTIVRSQGLPPGPLFVAVRRAGGADPRVEERVQVGSDGEFVIDRVAFGAVTLEVYLGDSGQPPSSSIPLVSLPARVESATTELGLIEVPRVRTLEVFVPTKRAVQPIGGVYIRRSDLRHGGRRYPLENGRAVISGIPVGVELIARLELTEDGEHPALVREKTVGPSATVIHFTIDE